MQPTVKSHLAQVPRNFYLAEVGTPGSIHHSARLCVTREQAERVADVRDGYWDNHPAATRDTSVYPVELTATERRVVATILDRGPVVLGQGLRVKAADLDRLAQLGLCSLSVAERWEETRPGRYADRSTTTVRLTRAGLAWAQGGAA